MRKGSLLSLVARASAACAVCAACLNITPKVPAFPSRGCVHGSRRQRRLHVHVMRSDFELVPRLLSTFSPRP